MMSKKSKSAGHTTNGEKSSSGFKWTPELDTKLLCLITLPRQIGAKEHVEIATALNVPTPGGVRNRVGKLKSDYRKTYEECGMTMPGGQAVSKVANKPADGPVGKSNTTATAKGGKKRVAKEMSCETDDHFSGIDGKSYKKVKTGYIDDFELEGEVGGIKSEIDEGI